MDVLPATTELDHTKVQDDLSAIDRPPDIPHRGPDFGACLSVKPCLPFSQELEEVLVRVGPVSYTHLTLPTNREV